jgi:RHS repeat-associated protein
MVGRVVPNAPQDAFVPQFDDDGNQTLIKTATGIWQVQYNGENRPILWTLVNSSTPNSSTPPLISMSYDRMGRRVTKNAKRFVYDSYLQIANFEQLQLTTYNSQLFIWDPTEPVATRPLVWNLSTFKQFNLATSYYTHDANKNVSEVISYKGDIVAHYEYAPFGLTINLTHVRIVDNPWQFSSEYVENDTASVYYNYRNHEPVMGRWICRDLIGDLRITSSDRGHYEDQIQDFCYVRNNPIGDFDLQGLLNILCKCSGDADVGFDAGSKFTNVSSSYECSRVNVGKVINGSEQSFPCMARGLFADRDFVECRCWRKSCTMIIKYQCMKKVAGKRIRYAWVSTGVTITGCK